MKAGGWMGMAAAALVLAGCTTATPYQPFTERSGGYRDQSLGGDRYRVAFAGNQATSPQAAGDNLLRRAAEIAKANDYQWFRMADQRSEGEVREIDTRFGRVRVSRGSGYGAWRDYGRFFTASGFGFIPALWRRTRSGEALEVSAVVEMGRGPPPAGEGVFRADEVLARLR